MTVTHEIRDQSSRCRGGASRHRSDQGFTLVEILVTIALVGTVVVAVLAGVRANIAASSISRSAAKAESAIVNIADRVNRAPKSCDYTIYAQAAVLTEGWSAGAVTVEQWHYEFPGYSDRPIDAGDWHPGACESGFTEPPDLLVQRVRVTVSTPDQKVSRTIELVKSDV